MRGLSLPEVIQLKNTKKEKIPRQDKNKEERPTNGKDRLNADVSGRPMVENYTAINMCEITRLNDKHDFIYSPSIALSKKEITAIQIKQRSKKALDANAVKALREKFAKE